MIVGLMGPMNCGKDTVGRVLINRHNFARFAFADAVKDAALALDPIVSAGEISDKPLRLSDVIARLGSMEEAKKHPEVRRTLQRLGTEVGREVIDPDVWVSIVSRRIRDISRVVITDVRFPNEAAWIAEEGGVLVRIRRDGTGGDAHASESVLEHIEADFEFDNNIPLDEVPAHVSAMLAEFAWKGDN